MTYIIVAVRDRALDGFMRPFFAQTTGQAIRMFGDEINRNAAENPLHAHPDDYDLYQLGVFNDIDGRLDTIQHGPQQIAIGKQLKGA